MNKLLKMMVAFVLIAAILPAHAERSMYKGADADEFDYPSMAELAEHRKTNNWYTTLDNGLVYFRGALLTVGSAATLYQIAQRMNFSNSADIAAFSFAFCMGVIVLGEAIWNLGGYRIHGRIVEKV